jgi:hypothetical protein
MHKCDSARPYFLLVVIHEKQVSLKHDSKDRASGLQQNWRLAVLP